eukprot:TRINITY_DN2956_c0_g2_i1.p1 TRINITY_DN2956_c0_g2~~TRINITY_DN2956_c0_g2_i1.p1  ORF type:complete len:103 (+),score=25.82 TRINITY_DN2956_c0_g2_i1:291-599(+)
MGLLMHRTTQNKDDNTYTTLSDVVKTVSVPCPQEMETKPKLAIESSSSSSLSTTHNNSDSTKTKKHSVLKQQKLRLKGKKALNPNFRGLSFTFWSILSAPPF